MAFRNTKYTKEVLEEKVKASLNLSEVLRQLGLTVSGGNHRHITSRIKFFEIDTSHFKSGVKRGKKPRPLKRVASNILVRGTTPKAHYLRRALKEVGIEEICAECNQLPWWNNKPLRLQVDHIDGDNKNNLQKNLRFLCPNCHTQTETYGARNISTYRLM